MKEVEYWKSTQLESYPNEEWKSLDFMGYPNYEVSNLGRVKSLNYSNTGSPKILKQCLNNHGYPQVQLWYNKKGWFMRVHRLVAQSFILNPKNKPYIDHKNCTKTCNLVSNLSWVSPHENNMNPLTRKHTSEAQKARGNKYCKFGKEHPNSIPIVQLSMNGNFIKKWSCVAEVQKETSVGANIYNALKGRSKTAYGYKWMYLSEYKGV